MNRKQAFIIADRLVYLEKMTYIELSSLQYIKRRKQLMDRLLE